ncbi:T-complex protein 1 subunit zeta [Tritrichomonas musculus]|uniref:T-complex protein 1 subunit zeta n=1 Tax=Tritrichomonas musculus TaxID=1915356 RepID=A0ABR2HFL2_9EUKA
MAAVSQLNQNAELYRRDQALIMNLNASHSLADILKTNLGPAGTLKMLVGGAGDVQLTKDGNVLLKNLTIIHPTAMLIARAAVAQDDNTGDGTTSTIVLIDGILKNCERRLSEGVHPRVLTNGLEEARDEALKFLDSYKTTVTNFDRELLLNIARTSIGTKLPHELVEHLSQIVTDAVLTIKPADGPADLLMVEQITMLTKLANDTQLVKGLVLDHGLRHPLMKRDMHNVYILALNVSLEFENTEVNTSFAASDAADREKFALAERKFVDDKVKAIIKLKNEVCTNGEDFLIINMKGIDPPSLELLYQNGISALRRAKRRNMERLARACGSKETNSVENLTKDNLGFAGHVWEQVLGEDHFTFVEDLKNPKSVTILMKGPNSYEIKQQQDAVRDGLRAVNNAIADKAVVPGAGVFEVALSSHLHEFKKTVDGKKRLGVEAYAEAVLEIPRVIAANAGHDAIDVLVSLQNSADKHLNLGINIENGELIDPKEKGIWDNYCVKKNQLQSAPLVASQLLLVDEILKAGKQLR